MLATDTNVVKSSQSVGIIPAGTFLMGSPADFGEDYSDELPQHEVEITKPFYMSVCTITQGEYVHLTGSVPESSGTENARVVPAK